ncbi:MAG: hypothetical protein LUH21_26755 [Clostridiales bacterium]|nr:hypothetical protein [Clostridiales bacterium]
MIKNIGMADLLASEKQWVIYGAGEQFENMLASYQEAEIWNRIAFVVDQYKAGKTITVLRHQFDVISLAEFIAKADCIQLELIITIEKYTEVIRELNGIDRLDGMNCFLWYGFLRVHTGKYYGKRIRFLPVKNYNIPRKIHYCWFGGKPPGAEAVHCIDSWKRNNPDYEIVEWNEKNFNTASNQYVKEAYEAGKYGFVSDYARHAVLAQFGGFYFDVDVELFSSLEPLRHQRGFISFESLNLLNSGSGFAAEADDPFAAALRDAYADRPFRLSGSRINETPCAVYETEYFKKLGVRIDDTYQSIEDFLILPHEVFAPVNQYSGALELTDNTMGIHHFACTWFEKEKRREWEDRKRSVEAVNTLLMKGWLERR